ncbi:MAG: ABC transporter substrate-binding protein [Acidobacteria bacterium]|nr:ABC transporter substrate-binding protein [Acidobacteriota bacterium]
MSLKVLNRRRFVGLLAGTLLFAACGADPDTSKPATTEPAVAETTAPADTTAAAEGDTASEKKMAAERIVSLSATATEMLYALGAEGQIVAVDNFSNYPQAAADFATKIDAFEPSVEAIAELDPTVVLLTYDPGDLQAQLEKLGIKVWIGAAAATLDDSYAQITELGDLTGKADEASALVESMKSEIESTITSMELPDAPVSYYYELDNTFYSLTSNTFIGQLMSRFMLQNIADTAEAGNDYPQLSAESIVSSNPQMIFLADTKCCEQTAETVAARAGWDVIDAVKNGNVVELDDDIASRWGPRVVDLVKVVAEAVTKFVAAAKG